ncbi:MAG: EAL domain-containing protein, partial [Bulleidia sp.]
LEESGLIWKLDSAVLEEVCRQYEECLQKGITPVPVSFNLDRQDFFSIDIFREVEDAARRHHVPRDFIQIEVTERVFSGRDPSIDTALHRFRNAGYAIWIDDFGSGYSTLNLLKDYDYDMLKIDMAFMLKNTERSRSIVQAIVQMNDRLHGASLCEGVETREQFEFLRSIGCDMVQGFWFSAPKPFAQVRAILKERNIRPETVSERHYFDAVNDVKFDDGIPFSIMETGNACVHFLHASTAFRKEVSEVSGLSLTQLELALSGGSDLLQRAGAKAARSEESTSFEYTIGEERLRITVRPLSQMEEKRLFLCEVRNITSRDALGEEKRKALYQNLVYLSDGMYEVDLSEDTISKSVLNTLDPSEENTVHGVREAGTRYCRSSIYPQDQARYLEFCDPENVMEKVREEHQYLLRACFRTRKSDGSYEWKVHALFYIHSVSHLRFLYSVWPLGEELQTIHGIETERTSFESPENCLIGPDGFHYPKADLFSSLSESSGIPLFLKDREHRYVSVNQGFLNLFGLKERAEISGYTDSDLSLFQEDTEAEEENVLNAGKNAYPVRHHAIIRGSEETLNVSLVPAYCDGKISGVIGGILPEAADTVLHGADLKDSDNFDVLLAAMASYQELYRLWKEPYAILLCHVPMIRQLYLLNDPETAEHAGREVLRTLHDTASGSVIGRLSGDSYAIVMQYHQKTEAETLSARIAHAVGQIRMAGSTPVTLAAEVRVLTCDMLAAADAEPLGKTLAEVPESSVPPAEEVLAQLRSIMDDSLVGTYIVKPDRTIIYWNHAAEEITGFRSEWMIGRRCSDTSLKHLDEEGNHLCTGFCPFLHVLESDRPAAKNVYAHRRDGSVILVRTAFTPIRDRNGTMIAVMEQFVPAENGKDSEK